MLQRASRSKMTQIEFACSDCGERSGVLVHRIRELAAEDNSRLSSRAYCSKS